MSYILDALKKSERERKRGNIPDLSNTPEPPTQKPKKRSMLPYLIGIVLLINAGLLVWWLVPREDQKHITVAESTDQGDMQKQAGMKHVSDGREGAEETNADTKPEKQKQEAIKLAEINQRTKLQISEEGTRKTEPNARLILPGSDEVESRETVSPPVPVDIQQTEPDQENEFEKQSAPGQFNADTTSATEPQQMQEPVPVKGRLYRKGELPISIQQELPDFRISMALYSDDPDSRVAKINGKTLKEGQFLEEGLKLEEIKPDGVVFNYRNYSFQINLK